MKTKYRSMAEFIGSVKNGEIPEEMLIVWVEMDKVKFEVMKSDKPFDNGIDITIQEKQWISFSEGFMRELFPKSKVRKI